MIDINKLAYICHSVRKANQGRDCAVTLNRDTYIKLWDYLRQGGQLIPTEEFGINSFQFYGCRVSWSPMFDKDPAGYVAGLLERAH